MSLLAKIVETIILIKLYLVDDTIEKIRKRGEKNETSRNHAMPWRK